MSSFFSSCFNPSADQKLNKKKQWSRFPDRRQSREIVSAKMVIDYLNGAFQRGLF